MRQLSERVGTFLSVLALAVAILATGAGCASSDPNGSSYQFPDAVGTPPPPALASSGSAVPAPSGSAVPTNGSPAKSASLLRIGDMINVTFSDVPLQSGLGEIRSRIPEDGMLTLHYSVRVKAAGQTIPELEREIRAAFVPKYFRNLTAIVRADDRFFYVGGEVKAPNRYQLQSEMTVLRAIDSAGGFTEFANHNKIELRRQDGTKVMLSEKKISKGQQIDLPVLSNDHIKVHKRWW